MAKHNQSEFALRLAAVHSAMKLLLPAFYFWESFEIVKGCQVVVFLLKGPGFILSTLPEVGHKNIYVFEA